MGLSAGVGVQRVTARTIGSVREGGSNKPIDMGCSASEDDPLTDYVVKLRASTRWGTRGLIRELYGTVLAGFLGLLTPPCAVVFVSDELAAGEPDPEKRARLVASTGENFGSMTVRNQIYPILPGLSRDEETQAADLFAFDMMIQNVDRRPSKPNVFRTEHGLVVIDFDLAFSFCDEAVLVDPLPHPWERAAFAPFAKDHLFYLDLRRNPRVDLDPFLARASRIDRELCLDIEATVPTSWRTDGGDIELESITSHLLSMAEHLPSFRRSVLEVLQ